MFNHIYISNIVNGRDFYADIVFKTLDTVIDEDSYNVYSYWYDTKGLYKWANNGKYSSSHIENVELPVQLLNHKPTSYRDLKRAVMVVMFKNEDALLLAKTTNLFGLDHV